MQRERFFGGRPSKSLVMFAVMSGAALFGALFGTMCCLRSDTRLGQWLLSHQCSALQMRFDREYARVMLVSFLGNAVFIALAFVMGLSAVSQLPEFILPFFRGIGLGVTLCGAVSGGFCRRMLVNTAAVLPGAFFSLVITVLACREAVFLSDRLAVICLKDRITDGMGERIKLYAARFAGLVALAAANAVIDCGLSNLMR